MTSAPLKPIFICGNDEYRKRLISLKLTGSFSKYEYISDMVKPAIVMTTLPYRELGTDCSPFSKCSSNNYLPKQVPGLLLSCKTLEQRQYFHEHSPRRVPMPVTVFSGNSVSVEAVTYVYRVKSIEQEYWDDWELHAYVSSDRPYPISCTSPEGLMVDISLTENNDFTEEGAANKDSSIMPGITKFFQQLLGRKLKIGTRTR
ncbi:zinc-type alcohol dehydrogenase [Fusarium beomiforme]|uniref:Zinc-type alcohol dehydrogenase n=1 Tax=Fusarium beomiforme TaxID=44412 RepID=A0A9P5DV79_9HYPO|nr:zinc-type alcohol dehydrogenase [Fusarium beomiforme]